MWSPVSSQRKNRVWTIICCLPFLLAPMTCFIVGQHQGRALCHITDDKSEICCAGLCGRGWMLVGDRNWVFWILGSRAKHCAAVKVGFSWAGSIKSDLHTLCLKELEWRLLLSNQLEVRLESGFRVFTSADWEFEYDHGSVLLSTSLC